MKNPYARTTPEQRASIRRNCEKHPEAYQRERAWWMQRKQIGEWAEMQFMARAAMNSLIVSKPWGETARYDFMTDHDGRLCRVQVKSSSQRRPEGAFLFSLKTRIGNKPG